jgi:hypothetical protein
VSCEQRRGDGVEDGLDDVVQLGDLGLKRGNGYSPAASAVTT